MDTNPINIKMEQQQEESEGSVKFTKDQIYSLIKNNSPSITYRDNDNPSAKSEVWRSFKIIYIEHEPAGFVKCNNCISIFKWNSRLGTKSLLSHKCNIPQQKLTFGAPSKNQLTITQMLPVPVKPVPTSVQRKFNDKVVIGLAKDLRPLRSVESSGFLTIAQECIKLGSVYGNHQITDILSHRTSLAKDNLPKISGNIKEDVHQQLKKSPSYPQFSFTFDMWTETMKNRHFLSMTVHFVDETYAKKLKLLGVREFPEDLRKTTGNIRNECEEILKEYFQEPIVNSIFTNSIAVTDGGANVVKVFSVRLPCFCHKLNLIVDHTFSDKVMEKYYPVVKETFECLKSLVKYFKKSELNNRLPTTLKQTVPTRWNSILTMLKSYVKNSVEVQTLLVEHKQINRINGLNEALIRMLIPLLQKIEEYSLVFSSDKDVTFDKIYLNYFALREHLAAKEGEDPTIAKIKTVMRTYFDQQYSLHSFHHVGAALNPLYKRLKSLPEETRKATYELIRVLLDKYFKPESPEASVAAPPPTKRKRTEDTFYQTLEDSDEDEQEPDLDELSVYLAMKAKDNDLLHFWKNASMLPRLRRLAAWIYGIPASSASDERVFSTTGMTFTPRRSLLGGKTAGDLTLIHKNF